MKGAIQGQPVDWLVDTGCDPTIISKRIYREIPPWERPQLRAQNVELIQADGTPLPIEGVATMTVKLGDFSFQHEVIVASLESEGLLGLGILMDHGGRIDLQSNTLVMCGKTIRAHQEGSLSCNRIAVAETVLVPAGHRMVITAKASEQLPAGQWLVEPLPTPLKNTLAIAKSLVEGGRQVVPIEVMNPGSEDIVLHKGTHAGVIDSVSLMEEASTPTRESSSGVTWETQAKSGARHPSKTKGKSRSEVRKVTEIKLAPEIEAICEKVQCPLTSEERVEFRQMLYKNRSVFKLEAEPLGKTDLIKHEIRTTTDQPIKQRPRRFPLNKREEGREQVEAMLKDGIIEPSSSPWASPVVLVKKKDGSLRFCVDYRKLNSVTIKDAFPLPRIDDSLDALVGASYFSTLDLASGFWQVGMTEDAKLKSAFATSGGGLFQFCVMPFGLANSPSTFERLMEKVLAGLQWQICLVYLDDIIVYSKDVMSHLERLDIIFGKLRAAGLKLKPKKCHLLRESVLYLGHVVSGGGVHTDPDKVKAVSEWGAPKDLTEVRSFLGLCSYYRRFIPHFSTVAKPLTKLTEKGQEFRWGPEQEEAWNDLKSRLVSAPILAYPDPDQEFILDTDASAYGIGAVLSQVQEGQERVIAYASRSLSKPERRYCVTRREMLAVVHFAKYFRHYLYGRKFTIRTDHGALRWLTNFQDPQGQVARWLEVLGTYDFEIQHRAGIRHNNADALSRGPCRQCGREGVCQVAKPAKVLTRAAAKRADPQADAASKPTDSDSPWLVEGPLSRPNMVKAQAADPILAKIIEWKKEGVKPKWADVAPEGAVMKAYWSQWASLSLEDGLLTRQLQLSKRKTRSQIVVPDSMKDTVLQTFHDAKTAGHMGVRRTLACTKQRFYWPSQRDSVKSWCEKCDVCARRRSPPKKRKAPLPKYRMGMPMETIALDISGPWPMSQNGNKYILVAVDLFTKWCEAYPIPNQDAKTVAKVLVEQFISRHGTPHIIHSDQGRNFESQLFKELCKMLGMRKTRTCSFNPKANGTVEQLNATVKSLITAYIGENQNTWDNDLHLLMMAYRATPHASSGLSPNEMVYGREVSMPVDVILGSPPGEQEGDELDYVESLKIRLENAYDLAREQLGCSAQRQKKYYDLNAIDEPYMVGDLVWLVNQTRRKGVCPKLQRKWLGPFLIVDKVNDVTYRIQKSPTDSKVVPFDQLKPYKGDNLPDWMAEMREKLSKPPSNTE